MRTCWSRSLLVGLVGAMMLWGPAQAQEEEYRRVVTVSGEGTVRVEPDMATVRFGIVSRAEDPELARQQNAEAAREAMNAIRELGIEERKMRLEALRLQPAREYDPDTRRYKEVGFEATRQVVVEVNDLDQLPVLVARIVQKGANRLDEVSYDLEDRTQPRNEALREAVTHARDKATLMATTLGVELGDVLRIDEQSFDFPRPRVQLDAQVAMAKQEAAAPEPEAYAAGEIEVRAQVQVVFALK